MDLDHFVRIFACVSNVCWSRLRSIQAKAPYILAHGPQHSAHVKDKPVLLPLSEKDFVTVHTECHHCMNRYLGIALGIIGQSLVMYAVVSLMGLIDYYP